MDNMTAAPANKRFYFEWLLPFLLRPRKLAPQVAQKRATWLTPLLVISLLLAARIWFATPATVSQPVDSTPIVE